MDILLTWLQKHSRRMKMNTGYASFLMLFLVIGIALGSESYLDYGGSLL